MLCALIIQLFAQKKKLHKCTEILLKDGEEATRKEIGRKTCSV
jgi:hypothetical protein